MKKMFLVLGLLFLISPHTANAQSQRNPCYYTHPNPGPGNGCNSVSFDTPLPVTGSITANLGGFHQESVLTPITATTGGVSSGPFTLGKTVVVSNAGTTNTTYCQLGASSTTSGQPILPGQSVGFTSTTETVITCATSTSTTTINFSVGTGLPTGWGGAGSSGGGGGLSVVDQAAFTQGTSAFTPSGGVFNDTATLSSGQQGTYRLTTKRAQVVDTDTTGNALYSAVTAPIPCQAQSTWNTNTGLTGTQAARCDGSANIFVDPILPTIANGVTLVKGTTAAMTGTASTQVLAAVATKVIYVTRIKCNNSSATSTLVQIQDGSGGTVLDTLAAGATFGGEQGTGATPLFWTTAGNGLFAQDVTTSASVICTASGYSG